MCVVCKVRIGMYRWGLKCDVWWWRDGGGGVVVCGIWCECSESGDKIFCVFFWVVLRLHHQNKVNEEKRRRSGVRYQGEGCVQYNNIIFPDDGEDIMEQEMDGPDRLRSLLLGRGGAECVCESRARNEDVRVSENSHPHTK